MIYVNHTHVLFCTEYVDTHWCSSLQFVSLLAKLLVLSAKTHFSASHPAGCPDRKLGGGGFGTWVRTILGIHSQTNKKNLRV